MATPADILSTFKKDLENLKDNDKYKINALTIYARDNKDIVGVAQSIVDITIKHVQMIPAGLKLLGLYVIDSIVKNVGTPYRKLYTLDIVDAFVHSFQSIRDEKGRLKLYNLRTTWKDIFPNSRMYELDIRVREHDPAWPLLASPPEAKAAFRSLPNVPKIQTKVEPVVVDVKQEAKEASLTTKTVISASRDPRLNRKRKSPQEPLSSSDEYLIDRSGDQNMESVARKQGKQADASESSKKVMLFGGEDCDMRSQNAVPASPARSSGWSDYIGKHSEICSRREAKDIDMRFAPSDPPLACSPSFGVSEKVSKPPLDVLVTNKLNSVPTIPPAPRYDTSDERLPPTELQSGKIFGNSNPDTKLRPDVLKSENIPPRYSKVDNFVPMKEHHLPPRITDFARDRPQLPSSFQPTTVPPIRGPPIRGPVWSVEINGFPDMVNIGVDPRMLSLVTHPKPPRRITIDGQQFTLLLDRVQPLIAIGDRIHAVRFRCEFATIVIDGRCFNIPGTGFTRVSIGPRFYVAYLGGPGHELVIDGRPHTVPTTSHLTFINVGLHSVGVKFVGNVPRNVNVLPPIPPRLLKWAGQGLFGSPKNLFMAPLNPIKELARLVEHGYNSRNNFVNRPVGNGKRPSPMRLTDASNSNNRSNGQRLVEPVDEDAANKSEKPITTNKDESSSNAITPLNIDVHELFKKLVKAGIVPSTEHEKKPEPPELENYSWERFKNPYGVEIDELYSGHQCGQCGLRFQSDLSPEFAKHLDYHYMKNSSYSQERRSRNFYQSLQYWLISEMTREGAPQFEPGSPIHDLQEYKCTAFADPSKNVCAVCYENFEVVWDHEEEEWMLQDAIRVDDKVYHPICQEDAGKEFSVEDEKKFPSPGPIENNPESTFSPEGAKEDAGDENAFTCDDFSTNTVIPGLSPSTSPQQCDTEMLVLKSEPECEFTTSVKTESILSNPTISADPLAALKAVLKGDISSLSVQPH